MAWHVSYGNLCDDCISMDLFHSTQVSVDEQSGHVTLLYIGLIDFLQVNQRDDLRI